MVGEIADLDLVVTDSEMEALALENNLIKRHKPPYNVRLRDDKNHPYLKLTLAEEYPRLYVVRRPVRGRERLRGARTSPRASGGRRPGLVRKLFGIRSCKETLNGGVPARACSTRSSAAWRRASRRSARSSATGARARTRGSSSRAAPRR